MTKAKMANTLLLLLRSPYEHVRGAVVSSMVIAVPTAAMAFVGSPGSLSERSQPVEIPINTRAPVPPPLLLRAVAPREAVDINRQIPFSQDSNRPALPFKMAGDRETFARAVECLATAIYYEAGAEPLDGQRAVAQVVLNRVRHAAFVTSVCGVVYEGSSRISGCQFSFTCNGSLRRVPSEREWSNARAIAAAALRGAVFAPVGYATHYHADYVVPYWAASLSKNSVVGRHIFYRWPAWWGTAAAFGSHYLGNEQDPRALRATALLAFSHNRLRAQSGRTPAQAEPDPRLELLRIVRFLADGSPASERASTYESGVRRHFSSHSEHLAVQIYRQMKRNSSFSPQALVEVTMHYSDPPELMLRSPPNPDLVTALGGSATLLGFMSALRDFSIQSDYDAFRGKAHRPVSGSGGVTASAGTAS